MTDASSDSHRPTSCRLILRISLTVSSNALSYVFLYVRVPPRHYPHLMTSAVSGAKGAVSRCAGVMTFSPPMLKAGHRDHFHALLHRSFASPVSQSTVSTRVSFNLNRRPIHASVSGPKQSTSARRIPIFGHDLPSVLELDDRLRLPLLREGIPNSSGPPAGSKLAQPPPATIQLQRGSPGRFARHVGCSVVPHTAHLVEHLIP